MAEVPIPIRALEPQPQGVPPLDGWMVEKINEAKKRLGEGEHIDPWYVSDLFVTYKEKIIRAEMDVREVERASEAILTEVPPEQSLYASAQQVQNAYDILAYPLYTVDQQSRISNEVHRYHARSTEPFTLQPREKDTLQKITTAIDISDNPQQFTYSFASIPPAPTIIEGNIR